MEPIVIAIWILAAINVSIVAGYFIYAKLVEPWLDVRKYGPRPDADRLAYLNSDAVKGA